MSSAKPANDKSWHSATKPAELMFHRVFRATPLAVRDTLSDIRGRFSDHIGEDAIGRLELVLAEVMNNVTEHGAGLILAEGQGTRTVQEAPLVHLCVVRHEGALYCAVTDDGVSLPDDCLQPRRIPQSDDVDMAEGGFGWFLIQDLTQELCYYREDRRNFLAFRVPVIGSTDKPA